MNDPDHTRERLSSRHFPMYNRYPITLVEGVGSRVRDSEGKEYIDALGGIAVNALGHCHPAVVAALREQAGRLIHCTNLYNIPAQADLAERLTEAVGLDRVFFTNSGTEAVEGALKLARRHALRHDRGTRVLSFEGCFHGRSTGALSTHSQEQRETFEPLLAGFRQLPIADVHALESALGDDVAAVIIEPVQGEGGVREVPDDFLRAVRSLCASSGALMIADEIQCGVGRTGRFNACDHAGVRPDIMVLAKSLGGGTPIGAVLADEEIAAAFEPGDHGTTLGGNPLVCAAANATLRVIEEENLIARAGEVGREMREAIGEAAASHPSIVEVRGRGMMIGVELNWPAKDLVVEMMRRGVLANCTRENVIRFLPALNMPRVDMERVVKVFVAALGAAEEERSAS